MSDGNPENFDVCEYVWNHIYSTRGVIEAVRQQQEEYCTESECINESPLGGNGNGDGSTALFFMMFWILMAMVLFFLRPRNRGNADKAKDISGPNGEPPAPGVF